VTTAWFHTDYGDTRPNGNQKDDDDLQWDFMGNSRLIARVKADKVTGYAELAVTSDEGALASSYAHDGTVQTRRFFGTWKFSDNASLKVGKDYTPTSQFISTQMISEDIGLLGTGTNYGRRPGQLSLSIGGFTFALIQPGKQSFTGGDLDQWLPKIEAGWGTKLDMFSINLMGGFQTYAVEDNTPGTVAGAVNDDFDVYSYILGADVGFNLGAIYFKAAGSYGQNWTDARWSDLGIGVSNAAGGAILKGNGKDVEDATCWQASLVAGLKFTNTLSFEVGGGYRINDSDATGYQDDEVWAIYGNATITLAPGVYMVPEVGYYDYMDSAIKSADDDAGYQWYAGIKWQIDF
jgi:hypothetical protein